MPKTDQYRRLTPTLIRALPCPEDGKRMYYYDTEIKGFAVVVQPSGAKSFYLYRKINKKPQRVLIGQFPDWSVENARKKAQSLIGEIVNGLDPSDKRARDRAEWTFENLFDWYFENHSKGNKRSSDRDIQNYNRHLKESLGKLPLGKFTKALIRETHMKIKVSAGPYAANRLLALISVIFSKAIAHEFYTGTNPAKGIEPFKEVSRDRRLSASELVRLLASLDQEENTTVRDFVYMLLYTAARRDNVLSMRWDQIDLKEGTWRIPLTKNGKPQTIPLEPVEIELLNRRKKECGDGDWVFPGRSDTRSGHLENPYEGWYRILERAEIEDFRLHDLRRTHGSIAADSGVSLHIIGNMLNQQSQAVTAIYARLSLDPVRQAKRRVLKELRPKVVRRHYVAIPSKNAPKS